jgi:hypothetical protein
MQSGVEVVSIHREAVRGFSVLARESTSEPIAAEEWTEVTVGSIHRMQSINVVILNTCLESVNALAIVEG